MKNKLLLDILIYIISPAIVCNIVTDKKVDYIIAGLILAILFYTFISSKKEYKINISGICISFIYIGFYLFKQSTNIDFEKYVYETYLLILTSIYLVVMRLVNINVIKQIYADILRAKGHTKIYIWNDVKNNKLLQEFEKTLQILLIHIMSIVFIKVYSIITYGINGYKTTLDLEIIVCILFIIVEIYMASRIIDINKSKEKKYNTALMKSKSINKNSNEKVIYLNKYKKTTK